MELFELRYFLKAAEVGNFTRAAELLQLSQPALSRAIARLEEELHQPLFERQGRTLKLTDAGVLLQVRANQALTLLAETQAQLADDGERGRLRIGAIPTIAPYFLPGLLRRFNELAPKATVLIHEDTTERLLQDCNRGELDLAILALPVAEKYLETAALFEEELLLILPPEHPLLEKRKILLKDIERFPFVLLNEAHCLSENIVSFCRRKSFQPVVMERTNQLVTVQELVSLGHGISMIPAMARILDSSNRRVYRSCSAPMPVRTVAMVWNPYRFQRRLVEKFKRVLHRYAVEFSAKLKGQAQGSQASLL